MIFGVHVDVGHRMHDEILVSHLFEDIDSLIGVISGSNASEETPL